MKRVDIVKIVKKHLAILSFQIISEGSSNPTLLLAVENHALVAALSLSYQFRYNFYAFFFLRNSFHSGMLAPLNTLKQVENEKMFKLLPIKS